MPKCYVICTVLVLCLVVCTGGWDSSTGPGMAYGGCCGCVLVFFSVGIWQSVVLCCTSVTQKWSLTLDQRSGWRSGLAKVYKMWHHTILLDFPFMCSVLLPYEVETCCQIKGKTLASCDVSYCRKFIRNSVDSLGQGAAILVHFYKIN